MPPLTQEVGYPAIAILLGDKKEKFFFFFLGLKEKPSSNRRIGKTWKRESQ